MIPKTCFILGAGLGTRLRPLTESLPKPLLPVGGRPLVSYAMDHCLTAGVKRFVVNTHYLAAAYDKAFPDGRWRKAPIVFCHEPVLLDTAGGLKNIEDLLSGEESLLVYNGDIISDLPLSRLLAAHREKGREVTLALRSQGAICNVSLDNLGEICDFRGIIGNRGVRSCLFTGIYIVERKFFGRLTRGRVESVILSLVEMIRQKPGSVASVVIDEGAWEDVGSPEVYYRIFQSVQPLKYEKLGPGPNAGSRTGEMPDGNGDTPAPDNGGVAGDAAAALPPEKGGNGPARDEEAFVRAALGIVAEIPVKLSAIGRGGSDRNYFRVAAPACPLAILMRYGDMYEENDVYVSAAAFLRDIGVSVPAIYSHSPDSRLILMEDLGDNDLYSWREKPWEGRRALYEMTLTLAVKMHAFSPEKFMKTMSCPPSPPFLMPGYDEKLYRWERNYFIENLVGNVCRMELDPQEENDLEAELAGLAERLLQAGTSLIHRDFQSQNVMIKEEKPVLIDFQGMRFGSLFYDLGSLLYDPYVQFPEGGRDALLRFYYDLAGSACPWEAFRGLFFQASAQRLMQALGAYGFLGLKRGKPHFLVHIPRALQNLVEVSGAAGALPGLNALARRCQGCLPQFS